MDATYTKLAKCSDLNRYKIFPIRLASFDSKWTSSLSPQLLCEAGFYYTGRGDIVKCQWCKVEVEHWGEHDNPFDRHLKFSPSCEFMNTFLTKSFAIINFNGIKMPNNDYHITQLSILEGNGNFNHWEFQTECLDKSCTSLPISLIRETCEFYRRILSYGKEQCKYLSSILKKPVHNIDTQGFPILLVRDEATKEYLKP